MRWAERQAKVEDQVYEAIEEIADEFGLRIPYYPDIFWAGRHGKTLLTESQNSLLGNYASSFVTRELIVIGNKDLMDIAEESAHFLHLVNSGVCRDYMCLNDDIEQGTFEILTEMVGYFGSKIVVPDRKRPIFESPDYITERGKFEEELKNRTGDKYDPSDTGVYQQAYCLGERLWGAYLAGDFTKKEARDLFRNNFEGNSTLDTFLDLRERLNWPAIV